MIPFIGHTGIGDSRGVTHDFAGPYYVSIDDLADSIDSIGKPKQTREEKILAWKQAQGMSIAS